MSIIQEQKKFKMIVSYIPKMASKDVLDQIRDLQSFIDDFVADAGSPTSVSPPPLLPEEKTESIIPEPLTKDTMLHKPDEVEDVVIVESKKIIEDKTAEEELVEEKVLVEQPLSMLSYDLNLSADFSSLLTQFNEIKLSPVEVKLPQPQNIFSDDDKEKIQLEPIIIDNFNTGTPKFSDSSFLNEKPTNSCTSPKSQSRRTSISSKKSQRSARSARSARRQNEKKLQYKQQQQQQQQQQQPQKYVERSYDEMMRIPDIYERLAFYEKTLDLCLKAESPIVHWCNLNKEKGKPQPMLEGYVPPVRSLSPEVPLSENGFGNMSSTFSGSISMFLKKAGGSHSAPKRPDNKSLLVSSSNYSSPYISSSGLFGKSLSRLNLSRSTQVPRYDNQLQPIYTPVVSRSMYNKQISSPRKTNSSLSPLCINYGHDRSANLIRTPRSSSSTPNSFGSTTTINSQGEFTSRSTELNYMINILPQIDIGILQNALDEAKGDPMVAISIAVSLNKLSNNNNNNHRSPMQSSKRYQNKKIK